MEQTIKFGDAAMGRSITAGIGDGFCKWVGIADTGRLFGEVGDIIIELYDCSDAVYESLSSDWSWVTLINHRYKPAICNAIRSQEEVSEKDDDSLILDFLARNFKHTNDIQEWLSKHSIPFRKFHDSGYGLGENSN